MGNESIDKILEEEFKEEKLREEGKYQLGGNENRINHGPYNNENQIKSDKIYIGVDGSARSDGPPKGYNGKNARIDEIKELNNMVS